MRRRKGERSIQGVVSIGEPSERPSANMTCEPPIQRNPDAIDTKKHLRSSSYLEQENLSINSDIRNDVKFMIVSKIYYVMGTEFISSVLNTSTLK